MLLLSLPVKLVSHVEFQISNFDLNFKQIQSRFNCLLFLKCSDAKQTKIGPILNRPFVVLHMLLI